MLQNPSKYHGNPLSHFLALHNSQIAHNVSHTHAMQPITALGQSQYHHQLRNNHHLRQTTTATPSQINHQHHEQQLSPHLNSSTHIIDDVNTSLDVGKSFTIAAILGLQKSNIEENPKDCNNVINLSMNSNPNNYLNENNNNNNLAFNNNNNNSSLSNNCKLNSEKATNTSNNIHTNFVNNFNCDNSVSIVNRYNAAGNGPTPSIISTSSSFSSSIISHPQPMSSNHMRANSFAAAAAVAVAAAANASNAVASTPSALQSLQQLHQHHAQQANLNYQREKLKSENKKTSLKNKRVRTIFTPEQLERLEAEFERQQYMVGPERLYLAHTLQLTEAQVKVWFQNRRIKWRKHHLELTQQRLALLRQGQLPMSNITEDSALPATRASSVSCDDIEDIKNEDRQMMESQEESESDLSICNESIDGDSAIEGGEDT